MPMEPSSTCHDNDLIVRTSTGPMSELQTSRQHRLFVARRHDNGYVELVRRNAHGSSHRCVGFPPFIIEA